jgi:hypothetical protein
VSTASIAWNRLIGLMKPETSLLTSTLQSLCFSYNKSQRYALFLNFILVKNTTCFGQIYCPSSGVLILYSQQLLFVILVMLTVSEARMELNKNISQCTVLWMSKSLWVLLSVFILILHIWWQLDILFYSAKKQETGAQWKSPVKAITITTNLLCHLRWF